MSALACNYSGEPFALPDDCAWWRVRRFRPGVRGRLDVVRDAGGQPLCIPVSSDFATFRAAVAGVAGRYRLDALDESRLPVADCDAAYATIDDPAANLRNAAPAVASDVDEDPAVAPVPTATRAASAPTVTAPFGTWPALPMPQGMTAAEYLLGEALRGQVMTMQILAQALDAQVNGGARVLTAGAEIIRAADGAHMPTRRPPPPPPAPPPAPVTPMPPAPMPRNAWPADDDDDEIAAAPEPSEPDMLDRLMRFADKVQGVIAPVADVARMVRGVEADSVGADTIRNAAPGAAESAETAPPAADDHLRTSHLIAVGYELGQAGPYFLRLLRAMEPDDRTRLTLRLCALPLEQAAEEAARLIARMHAMRTEGEGAASADEAGADGADEDPTMTPDVAPPVAPQVPAAPPPTNDARRSSAAPPSVAPASAPVPSPASAAGVARVTCASRSTVPPSYPVATYPVALHPTGAPAAPPAVAVGAPSAAAGMVSPAELASLTTAELVDRLRPMGRALKVSEVMRVQRLVGSLSDEERDAWLRYLAAMPVDQAVQVVRAELARRGV